MWESLIPWMEFQPAEVRNQAIMVFRHNLHANKGCRRNQYISYSLERYEPTCQQIFYLMSLGRFCHQLLLWKNDITPSEDRPSLSWSIHYGKQIQQLTMMKHPRYGLCQEGERVHASRARHEQLWELYKRKNVLLIVDK